MAKAKPYNSAFPRFFGMTRYGGWYVCDATNLDRTNLARPVHEEACADQAEARSIAAMLNDENDSWGDMGPRPEWS